MVSDVIVVLAVTPRGMESRSTTRPSRLSWKITAVPSDSTQASASNDAPTCASCLKATSVFSFVAVRQCLPRWP